MAAGSDKLSVLLVTASEKTAKSFGALLPQELYLPIKTAASAGEARRAMLGAPAHIVIIDTPLKDDFGVQLAADLAQNEMTGVVLLVKSEQYDHVFYKTESLGILTLSKPLERRHMLQCLGFLSATRHKLIRLRERSETLEKKMEEISLVNRAKLLLMEKYRMTEADAHRYIEKSAMDHCVKRREIAKNIIDNIQKVR